MKMSVTACHHQCFDGIYTEHNSTKPIGTLDEFTDFFGHIRLKSHHNQPQYDAKIASSNSSKGELTEVHKKKKI